jgi:uncharacterized membrane protein
MAAIYKEKILWCLFYFVILSSTISGAGQIFHWSFVYGQLFQIAIIGVFPILLLLLHASWTLTPQRGLLFILLAFFVGLLFEVDGLRFGTFFGGQYAYHIPVPLILGVPFLVPLYWAFYIYTGYCITSSFLYWLAEDKPNKYNRQLFWLILLVILDGIIVTAIDLFMDPIEAKIGAWTWLSGGSYFGVPLDNFFGWFIVTIIVTFLFRSFEYFYPAKPTDMPSSVYLIPLVGYIFLALFLATLAIQIQLYTLACIGLLTMGLIVVANLFYYKRNNKRAGFYI